jgi:hypothetical protein
LDRNSRMVAPMFSFKQSTHRCRDQECHDVARDRADGARTARTLKRRRLQIIIDLNSFVVMCCWCSVYCIVGDPSHWLAAWKHLHSVCGRVLVNHIESHFVGHESRSYPYSCHFRLSLLTLE